jgi:hypothetical protein
VQRAAVTSDVQRRALEQRAKLGQRKLAALHDAAPGRAQTPPRGIVTVELAAVRRGGRVSTQACPSCAAEGHDPDARFCKRCGAGL